MKSIRVQLLVLPAKFWCVMPDMILNSRHASAVVFAGKMLIQTGSGPRCLYNNSLLSGGSAPAEVLTRLGTHLRPPCCQRCRQSGSLLPALGLSGECKLLHPCAYVFQARHCLGQPKLRHLGCSSGLPPVPAGLSRLQTRRVPMYCANRMLHAAVKCRIVGVVNAAKAQSLWWSSPRC